jgi:EF-P beta-lysylation protein EpmB
MSSSKSSKSNLHIITRTAPSWHQSLSDAFRNPRELLEYLDLGLSGQEWEIEQDMNFPMLVPREFASKMEKGNPEDPLLLQVIPSIKEFSTKQGYSTDPVDENSATIAPGLLHKYRGRALLITTGACPVHCRYCFRRHFPYSESSACGQDLDSAIEHLKTNKDITEVILSGGDPFMLKNSALATLFNQLEQINHLKRVRIHSRMPVVIPTRIDQELIALLANSRFKIALVIHCNHPKELDQEVKHAIETISRAGITVLNQSVMLQGVNDSFNTLKSLSERLFSCGALPYYLHMLDRVTGAMHFEVGATKAMTIHKQLQNSLPGYLVPKLVYEKAGAKSKLALS